MDLHTEVTALTALSAGTFLVGVLLILFFGPTLTTLGIVLVTVGGLVFIVDAADVLGHWRQLTE